MSQISNQVHYVFSTKSRQRLLSKEVLSRLFNYISQTAINHKIKVLKVGGVEDHLHILARLPATMDMAKGAQLLKGNSSRWINKTFKDLPRFDWQSEYGGFVVSGSHIDRVSLYIQNQEEHHKSVSFEDEFEQLLERNQAEGEMSLAETIVP